MKLVLVLLCAVTYHYCDGYPVIDGEIPEAVSIENDTSVEYLLDTTDVTPSNDTLLRHGYFKKGGRYIGGYRPPSTNSGSGAKNPEAIKWALIGTGVALLVALGGLSLYYYQTLKRKRESSAFQCQYRPAGQ